MNPNAAPGATRGVARRPLTQYLLSGLAATLASGLLPMAAHGGLPLSDVANGTGGFLLKSTDLLRSENDRTGYSVSMAGDVNGDGLSDMVIGAPRAYENYDATKAGRAYVVFGRTGTHPRNLDELGANFEGFMIKRDSAPPDVGPGFGSSVSGAGDVNGDGYGDVIVAYHYPGALSRCYVVFGGTSNNTVLTSSLEANIGGFVIDGIGTHRPFVGGGGDLNNDGFSEVLVGVPFSGGTGAVFVVFGSTVHAAVSLSDVAAGTGGFIIRGEAGASTFGANPGFAGDVNGDGITDIVCRLFSFAHGGLASRGYVVFGKPTNTAVEATALVAGTGGFVIDATTPAMDLRGLGISAAGDVNGDGLADVVMGTPYAYSSEPGFFTGRGFVIFGKSGTAPVGLPSVAAGTGGFAVAGSTANGDGSLARSVGAAGDTNGDGLADVLVGDDSGNNGYGAAHVVHGKTSTSLVQTTDVAAGTGGVRLVSARIDDHAGYDLSSAGDVNGDGLADLIVGAPGDSFFDDPPNRTYVVLSPFSAAPSGTYRTQLAAGDIPRTGIGVHAFGNGPTVIPDARVWVDFDGGTGPGLGASSEVEVTLTRADAGIAGIGTARLADVQWRLDSDRSGWSTCRVTVQYTNAEIAGQSESQLVLHTAPSPAGPFTPVGSPTLDVTRNQASGVVSSLPAVFVLVDSTVVVRGDANNDGSADVGDVTAIYNHVFGVVPGPLAGNGDVEGDGDVDSADADWLIYHLVDGWPLP